jgi:NhaP-type Na+/H+ or K+/H+ antiporter
VDPLNVIITVLGALVILIGLFSSYVNNRLPVTLPLLATACGVLLGPAGLRVFDPQAFNVDWPHVLGEVARLTVAVSLMEIALRLPRDFVIKQWRSLALMLGVVMPLMFLTSGLLAWVFLPLPAWSALLLGACVTPTDPVASSAIVTGRVAERRIPARLRYLISAESGANDGLAYPLVLLPILMLQLAPSAALREWIVRILLEEVVLAVLVGAALGWAAGTALEWAERKGMIETRVFLGYTVAVSLVTLGGIKLLGSDGILAVFAAGVAINRTFGGHERVPEEHVQEVVNLYMILPAFLLFGALLPWATWATLGWPGWGLAAAILLARRLPAVLLTGRWVPLLKNRSDRLFAGWFGPIAVAAMYYIALARRELGAAWVWDYGMLIVLSSIVVHGLTALPVSGWYHRNEVLETRAAGGAER